MSSTLKKIKNEALMQFNEKGFEGTTMKDIFKRIGMQPSAFYYYYQSKNQLFSELIRECQEEHYGVFINLCERVKAEAYEIQLYEIFKGMLVFQDSHPQRIEFFIRSHFMPAKTVAGNFKSLTKPYHDQYICKLKEIFKKVLCLSSLEEERWLEGYVNAYLRTLYSYMIQRTLEESLEDMDLVWRLYWNGITSNNLR